MLKVLVIALYLSLKRPHFLSAEIAVIWFVIFLPRVPNIECCPSGNRSKTTKEIQKTDHIRIETVLEPITLLLGVVLNSVKVKKNVDTRAKSFDLLASVSQN